MKTLTEKYNAVLSGKYPQSQFVRDARLAHPNLITQFNGFEDTVTILKNKGMISEQLERYKEETAPEYTYESETADTLSFESIERGVDYELSKKGLDTVSLDFSEDELQKAREKAIKNLSKDPLYYTRLLSGQKKVTKRTDIMTSVDKNNFVDKGNQLTQEKLKEGFKRLIVKMINEGELEK